MKFKREGKVFDDILLAHEEYCQEDDYTLCATCTLSSRKNGTNMLCPDFCTSFPEKAATLMGFEVIKDESDPKSKPHICEVLGVEVGEGFTVKYPNREYEHICVHEDGMVWEHQANGTRHKIGSTALCWIINHPEAIKHLPRLTDKELEICMALDAKWITRDSGEQRVYLWSHLPTKKETQTDAVYFVGGDYVPIAGVIGKRFPSVNPGDCICVEDLLKSK